MERIARVALVGLLLSIAPLPLVGPAPALAQALSCGRSTILLGDPEGEVLRKCGPPSRRQSIGRGGLGPATSGSKKRGSGHAGGRGRELWVYDLGSRQLVRYLSFEGGRLVRIDFGDYGRGA